jgi:glutathione S-transferase
MKLELYYAPVACSLVPYVTLTEAGASFEVHPVNTGKRQQMSPDYLKINPKHKVPVLVIDGEPLSENVAIQQWIHRHYPEAKILPADPMKEFKAISLLAWCASGIHPYLGIYNAPTRVCDLPGSEETVRKCTANMVYEAFKIADGQLAGREWFFEHFTAPDAHFFWCYRRGTQLKLDLAPFKNCQMHFDRMQKRPSVQKVLAFEKQTQEAFAKAA